MKKILTTLLTTLMLTTGLLSPIVATTVYAQSDAAKSAACEGVSLTGGSCDNDPNGQSSKKINSVIGTVINLFSLVVGVTSVIMIIVGGFKYIISSGDSASVNSAKNTILYALVGLVIVALAQVIVQFVIGKI